jgi:hypothetical protein
MHKSSRDPSRHFVIRGNDRELSIGTAGVRNKPFDYGLGVRTTNLNLPATHDNAKRINTAHE